jgi:protein SCO1
MPTRRELITGRFGARAATARPIRAPKAGKRYGAEYFSNVTLTTHEGNKVRFYDDLIRGKIAVINMMYAQCEGICPTMTANLVRVQELLGERVGREIFMYSITLLPEQDTPQNLREYAEMHGVKPGWLFLTGTRAGIQRLRYQLGFYDPDPVVDGDKSSHTRAVRIGNDIYDRWLMAPALAEPKQIVATINHVDKSVVHTWQKGVTAADST